MSIRKLYIDSRHRSSGTPSDFNFQLKQSIEVPENTIAFIDAVQVANTFESVQLQFNDKVYLREHAGGTSTDRIATLAPSNYDGISLATALGAALNSGTNLGTYTVTFDPSKGTLTIGNNTGNASNSFTIYTRDELSGGITQSGWNGPTVNWADLQDASEVIGTQFGAFPNCNDSANGLGELITDEFVDLLPVKSLYIHGNLGSFSSLGPVGQTDIIRRVVVSSGYGNNVTYHLGSSHDYIDVSSNQLSNLQFSLRDSSGRIVNLRGRHLAFSITFERKYIE